MSIGNLLFTNPAKAFPLRPVLVWGDYIFKYSTFSPSQMDWLEEYRWVQIDRVGARPIHQAMGVGRQTLILQGKVIPLMPIRSSTLGGVQLGLGALNTNTGIVGSKSLQKLEFKAQRQDVEKLRDGNGTYYGRWFIDSIQKSQRAIRSNGMAADQDVLVRMVRFGDDELTDASVENLLDQLFGAVGDVLRGKNPLRGFGS